MEKLQKLYNVLTSQGLYTKSYDEFEQQYQDESYRQKVFDVVSNQGLYTKSQEEFFNQYSPGDTVVSNDEIVEDVITDPMGSINFETGEKKNPDLPSQPSSESPSGLTGDDITSESFITQSQFDTTDPFAQTILADDYSKNLGQNTFEASINSIDEELTSDREEEVVIPEMNYKFNQYGFTFEETGGGDRMIVRSSNDKEISVPLDAFGVPFVEGLEFGAKKRANKLVEFLRENKEESEKAFNAGLRKEEAKLNKIQNEKELKALNTLFNTQVDRFAEDVKGYSAEKIRLDRIYRNAFGGKTPQELSADPNYNNYMMATERLDMVRKNLQNRQKTFIKKGKEFDEMVGSYVDMRTNISKQGARGGMLFLERLSNSFLEGIGGAGASVPEELAAGFRSLMRTTGLGFNAPGVDDSTGFFEHIDFAVDRLSKNKDGNYKLDDVNLLGEAYADELQDIKEILNKGDLDALDQKRLENLFLEIGPQDLAVVFDNITSDSEGDLVEYTSNAIEQTTEKAFREYAGDPFGLNKSAVGEGDVKIFMDGEEQSIGAYERAKSATMGDAFNQNIYTGRANIIGRDLEEGSREQFRKVLSRYVGQETLPDEMLRKAYKNNGNDFQKAMHGVAYSVPAFVGVVKTGGKKATELTLKYGPELGKKLLKNRQKVNKTSRIIRLLAQSNEAQLEKMSKNPNFDNIDEGEKRLIAYPVAIATAVLEDLGFRNIINSQGLLNGIVGRALNRSNKSTTSRTFAEYIRKDLKNLMRQSGKSDLSIMAAQGGSILAAGAAAEFETGALQSVAELGSEYIFNLIREKFQGKDAAFYTPESIQDFLGEVVYQGYLEALGGKIMAVPTAISAMASDPNDLDLVTDEAFSWYQEMLKDPQYKKFFVTNLKQRVADPNDPLTQEGADGLLANYNQIEALMPQIPSDYTVQQSRLALNLLLEKQNLENKIDGKSKELTKKDQDRIQEINQQLEDITTIAAKEQQDALDAESRIPEFGTTKTQVETTEELDEDGDISVEERQDIEEAFGTETETEQTQENLFFNRKGKTEGALDKEQVSMRNKVINKAVRAAKSLANTLKTQIVLHESSDEFNKATGRSGRGFYDFDNNTIHIDMNKANETTVAHEAFHAALYQTLGEKNIGAAVSKLTRGIMNGVDKNTMLYKKADAFAKAYKDQGATIQNEERLAELFGMMAGRYQQLDTPARSAILNFVKSVAKTLGLDKLVDIGPIVSKDDVAVIELLNTLADKVATGQEIFTNDLKTLQKSEPYTEGTAATVNPKSKAEKVPGREQKVFKGDMVSDLPTTTLNDFAAQHNGNIYVITSDATAFDPDAGLYGGFGYAAMKDNNENGVGFASLDKGTALRNMDKLKKKFKAGERVGVAVMIQTPDAMYGNMYGAEFLYDALEDLQKKDPAAYKKFSKDMAAYKNNRMGGQLSQELQDMIIDPSSVSETDFVDAMKNENFDRRRYYMTGIIPDNPNLKTNKSTPAYKKALLENGTNTQDFNLEFGDKALLGEKFLKENKGGYVVGGFTYVVPENTEELVDGVQDKGFTHPFFVGKVPSEANSAVIFDGLYSVANSLQPYMPDTLIGDKTKTEEINERVREQYQDDKFYQPKRIEGKPLDQRTYTDLKGVNKVEFKNRNKDLMVVGKANAVSMIAQSKLPLFETITEKITDTPRGREQKEIVDIIVEGRTEYNFRDELIKDYLVRVKGYPASVVNKLMNIDVDLFNTLPKTFANIKGGMEAGIKLFKRVKAFEQKLIKSNKRRKVKLTEQQIADQTIEFLQKQPEYINEGDGTNSLTTKQAMLQVEFQRAVGTRTSESVQEKLTAARRMVQQRKRGARDLQQVKASIRNFIRKSLPADIYTRSEVMSLVRKVTNANESNIENIFDEVVEFVNEKNNARLERKIENILNGKYETKQSGRKKAAKISLKIKERIERIKKDRLNKTATAEEIEKENQMLTEEFNKIAGQSITTEGDFDRMVDLQILINLNNSLLMENNDVNKTGALDTALATLEEMIQIGRSELKQQLEDAHNKYNEEASVAYEEVTGDKVDLGDKDTRTEVNLKNQKRLNAKRNKLKNKMNAFLTKLSTSIKKVFNYTEALDGLMDLISKMPGELFGGRLQDLVTAKVDASTRMFKGRMMQQEEVLAKKFEELYGKKWRNKVRSHNKPEVEATYLLDAKAVEDAKKAYEQDPSLENKQNLKQVLSENEVHLSQNEMIYYYNLYKDPANRGSFEATFGENYAQIMEQIESKMDPLAKEFADWQVNEFYPSLYEHYNKTYRALYRTNMPWNRFYSGMIYRNDAQGNPIEQETLDLLSDKSIRGTSVGASSTKVRVQNNLPIRKMNAMNTMATYLRDMEYFAAYGETIRDIHKIFSNKQVREAISAIHGDYVNKLINDMIGKIANKGVRNTAADRLVNFTNNLFIFSKIGLNPTVMIKQLTSMITYANDIGYGNWLKYSLKNIPQIKKTFNEISENSVYMQDRNRQSITRIIESYSEDNMVEFVPNQYWDSYVNFIMYTTKFGDKAAIYLGGMPNYLYYKDQALKRGLSEEQAKQEAILKFEKDTKRTQQSMDLQDRDYFQTSSALARGLNMFLTTPKQYLRKEIQSTRNLYRKLKAWDRNAGKGTLAENIRTFLTYHLVAPSLFQFVALGLPGILRPVRDDDEEDMIRAAILGNLNALFIIGDIVNVAADYIQDKPYAGKRWRNIAPFMTVGRVFELFERAANTKDPEKKALAYEKAIAETISITSLPAEQIRRFIRNMQDLGKEGDIGRDLLRLINYSPYVIEGPKEKKSSKTKSVAEQNAEYYKQQQRLKRQSTNLSKSDVFKPIR